MGALGSTLSTTSIATTSDLTTHEADTTSVHGITDTSTLYRSGGTDVAVADGGTGASTAATARTNLGAQASLIYSRAVYSGGSTLVGLPIPGGFVTVSTLAQIIDSVRYTPLIVMTPITIDQILFEVTTAPASNANFRSGLYAADTDWQPSGAPLFDQVVAVASGFTGVKTATVSVVVQPGRYLSCYNMDVAMTNRRFVAPMLHLDPGLGASPGMVQFVAAQTYGAFPTPGTAHTGGGGLSNNGMSHCVLWRWTA